MFNEHFREVLRSVLEESFSLKTSFLHSLPLFLIVYTSKLKIEAHEFTMIQDSFW